MLRQRRDLRQGVKYLLWAVLILLGLAAPLITFTACQNTLLSTPESKKENWTPPYLQLALEAGAAQLQRSSDSEWVVIGDGTNLTIESVEQITTDEATGARFSLGDGSTLDLGPGTTVELQNPRIFPLLQVKLQQGTLSFTAQAPSYEFHTPVCTTTLLRIPAQVRIEVSDEVTHLAVEEGAVDCLLNEEKLTVPTCQELYARPGEKPEITEFCTANTPTITPLIPNSPTPTHTSLTPEATIEPGGTPIPLPSSSPTPTPVPNLMTPTRVRLIPTSSSTPVPPTEPPPPPPSGPKKTSPPPTNPPPTNPPPTNPPPTKPPPTQPPPTNPPPTQPPPTSPPPTARPTLAPTVSRPTPTPNS